VMLTVFGGVAAAVVDGVLEVDPHADAVAATAPTMSPAVISRRERPVDADSCCAAPVVEPALESIWLTVSLLLPGFSRSYPAGNGDSTMRALFRRHRKNIREKEGPRHAPSAKLVLRTANGCSPPSSGSHGA